MREKMYFADCNFRSFSKEHQTMCQKKDCYVPPYKRYTDLDGIIHHPAYPTPSHNPDNFEDGEDDDGIYKFDLTGRAKLDRLVLEVERYIPSKEPFIDDDSIIHVPPIRQSK